MGVGAATDAPHGVLRTKRADPHDHSAPAEEHDTGYAGADSMMRTDVVAMGKVSHGPEDTAETGDSGAGSCIRVGHRLRR